MAESSPPNEACVIGGTAFAIEVFWYGVISRTSELANNRIFSNSPRQ